MTGAWTVELEGQFDQQQPFRQTAIDAWGILEYALFRDGGDGVLIGDAGWLFTTEEFLQAPSDASELARKLAYIVQVQAQLAAVGSELVVALLPAKARIYPEYLGPYRLSADIKSRYAQFRQALVDSGIHAPDLVTALMGAKLNEEVFLRTDTHWTPFGARVVAGVLARHAAEHRLLPSQNGTDYRVRPTGSASHRGDLLRFIPLGVLQDRIGPPADTLELFELEVPNGGNEAANLFGDVTIPVTLIGTSYSANPLWNIENALKETLGADVLNVADQGLGPTLPMANFLDSQSFLKSPPELVIWEIPERFLVVEYEVP